MNAEQVGYLTRLSLQSTYFRYEDSFFKQTGGMAMGSTVVASLFMKCFKQTASTTSNFSPKIWYIYVDDTFVLWEHRRERLDDFLEHINGLHNDLLDRGGQ